MGNVHKSKAGVGEEKGKINWDTICFLSRNLKLRNLFCKALATFDLRRNASLMILLKFALSLLYVADTNGALDVVAG